MVHSAVLPRAILALICTVFIWPVFIWPVSQASARVVDDRQKVLSTAAVSLSQAMEQAQVDYNGFAIEGVLREKEGMYFYQIDVITEDGGAEVYINPANGVVIGADVARRYNVFSTPRNDTLMIALADARISFKEAVSIAVSHFTGIVFDIRLEQKLGRYVYEIGVFDGERESELEIAIDSGEVVNAEGKLSADR